MTEKRISLMVFGTIAALMALVVCAGLAHSQDALSYPCPAAAKSCKIVVITPEEETTLTNNIFPAALWANRTFTDLVEAWKAKIAAAPAGKVAESKPVTKPVDKK